MVIHGWLRGFGMPSLQLLARTWFVYHMQTWTRRNRRILHPRRRLFERGNASEQRKNRKDPRPPGEIHGHLRSGKTPQFELRLVPSPSGRNAVATSKIKARRPNSADFLRLRQPRCRSIDAMDVSRLRSRIWSGCLRSFRVRTRGEGVFERGNAREQRENGNDSRLPGETRGRLRSRKTSRFPLRLLPSSSGRNAVATSKAKAQRPGSVHFLRLRQPRRRRIDAVDVFRLRSRI